MTEVMIKQYLEHYFEPSPNGDFKIEPPDMRRLANAYPASSPQLNPTGF